MNICHIKNIVFLLVVVFSIITACSGSSSKNIENNDASEQDLLQPSDSVVENKKCTSAKSGSGKATFYNATGIGNCSYDPTDDSMMVAAMNNVDYGSADWCGACMEVSGPKGSVVVKIVDRCPECQAGDIDLSSSAFNKIADPVEGIVDIRWRIIDCSVKGSVKLRFKSGSNPWWSAVQIRNHATPIEKVEYLHEDGQYVPLQRKVYNYFQAGNGLGNGPYTFRITDSYGQSIEEKNVPLVPEVDIAGSDQLPRCKQ